MPPPSDTPAQLRYLRRRRGLTLEEVADLLGESYSNVAKKERGDVPIGLEQLKAWAALLQARAEVHVVADDTAPDDQITPAQADALRALRGRLASWSDERCESFVALLGTLDAFK